MRRATAACAEVAVPLAAVAIWWWWSRGSTSFYFPPLSEILSTFRDTWLFERVGSDVAPSLARLVAGFALAVVLGIGGGVLLGVSRIARRTAAPVIEFLRAIPAPALLPAAILLSASATR